MVSDTLSLRKTVLLTAHFESEDDDKAAKPVDSELREVPQLKGPLKRKRAAVKAWRFRASRTRSLMSLPQVSANNPWEEAFARPSLRTAPDVRIDIWLMPGVLSRPCPLAWLVRARRAFDD